MSWFNFYYRSNSFVPFDYEQKRKDDLLEQEWKNHRGQDICCYDDVTGELLSPAELESLDNSTLLPQIFEDKIITIRSLVKRNRKYTPRKTIPKELRTAVYQLYDHKCMRCNSEHANQIHHADGDPSNNHIRNLKLCCYDCHLILDGKQKFRIKQDV